VRYLVAALVLATACEREPASSNRRPPPAPAPEPTKLDPVTAARAEFDVVSSDLGAGTSKVYSRGDFLADGMLDSAGFDEGDFLGRARTLFGPPRDGDNGYVLRHKHSGLIVTLYSAQSGPSYGAMLSDRAGLTPERIAADPILAKGAPQATTDMTAADQRAYWTAMHAYTRHMADVTAGPTLAAAIGRLDALVSAVKPADWESTYYYDETSAVMHVGARGGTSFADELEPDAAMTWLLDGHDDDRTYYDHAVVDYYRTHPGLTQFRARLEASLRRFEAAAAREPDSDLRTQMTEEAREMRRALR
jgi:hypothetical protein